jgi:hypothetical protein
MSLRRHKGIERVYMSIKGTYVVRNMTADEVEKIAAGWAADEGWNPGLHDARIFYATDPSGFFVGLLDDVPVACISAVAYNNAFGFVGFYIVKAGFRNEGYSIRLCHSALKYLGDRNIGIDGVVEQQQRYKKLGYLKQYNNIRHEGKSRRTDLHFPEIAGISEIPFNALLDYDTALFPVSRPGFLTQWINQPGSSAFAALQDGDITGYGVIRRCRTGYKIGPLFADSKVVAKKLIITLQNSVPPGELFYLDIPDVNQGAMELTGEFQMRRVFETARMYSRSFPKIDLNRVFGVTSFELG